MLRITLFFDYIPKSLKAIPSMKMGEPIIGRTEDVICLGPTCSDNYHPYGKMRLQEGCAQILHICSGSQDGIQGWLGLVCRE